MENTFEKKIVVNPENALSVKLSKIVKREENADGTIGKRLLLSKKSDFRSENQYDIYRSELVFAIRAMNSGYDEKTSAEAMNMARVHLESAMQTLLENADIIANYNLIGKKTVRFFAQTIGVKSKYALDGSITFTEASVNTLKKLVELLVYAEINGLDFYDVQKSASNDKVLSARKAHEKAEAEKAAKKSEAEAKKANKAKAEADAKANREAVEKAVKEAKAEAEAKKTETKPKSKKTEAAKTETKIA